ncbi:MAG: hypothetical protein HY360_18090 [Verrucomicrobia bacterium]|nr:hypothetical protein [Verrucomicrobiota bacterium]
MMLILLVCFAALLAGIAPTDELLPKDNLIADGGFEEVRSFPVSTDPYIAEQVQNGCDLTDGPIVTLPSNFDQVCDVLRKLRVVEGAPDREVHSGKRAILMHGGFYVRPNVKAAPGDAFRVVIWAKGEGTVRLAASLYPAEGACIAGCAGNEANIQEDEWVRVEHTLEIKREHAAVKRAAFYIQTTGPVYLDDLSVTRIAADSL